MTKQEHNPRLLRGLSFVDATSFVIGTIIGTGVFLKAAVMSQLLGSSWQVLLAWFAAGLLSLAGALTYAELGCLFPKAGGEYVYLREAYGDLPAFLYGWMRFWIGGPGSVAAFAVGGATFFSGVVSLETPELRNFVAVGLVVFFTALNCLSVSVGGKIVTVITAIKLFLIMGLPVSLLVFGSQTHGMPPMEASLWPSSWSLFGTAMIAALWAFDGWNSLPMLAGEVRRPEVNLPRALIIGTGLVLVIYGLVNFSYFYSMPLSEIVSSSSSQFPNAPPVAAKAAQVFLGSNGLIVFSVLILVSALGAMNGSIMSAARVPYALAHDGIFPKFLGRVSASTHVPYVSLIVQGVLAVILALSGSFDQLTDYVVLSSWIFYALVAYAVFIFRKRLPKAERAYKTWGYPVVPMVFITMALLLVINTLVQSFSEAIIGLVLILSGIPVYYIFYRRKKAAPKG